MSVTKQEITNEVYDASLITLDAVGVSCLSKRAFKDSLGVPSTIKTY